MNKVGIGIPIYKDLDNLRLIIAEIARNPELKIDFYILDNGSNDIKLNDYLNSIKLSNVFSFKHEVNLGFGGGIKHLLNIIPNDFIGWMPGNGKVNPSNLKIIDELYNHSNYLFSFKANRSDRSWLAKQKTFASGLLISAFFRRNLLDSGGTPTIVPKHFKNYLLNGPDDFSFEAFSLYIIRRMKLDLFRANIPYGKRRFGNSHWQIGLMSELKLLLTILKQKGKWNKILRDEIRP